MGGGSSNLANGTYATVAGGTQNIATDVYATVGGGGFNNASSNYATIAGGRSNSAAADEATVGGGFENSASGPQSIVGGGRNNVVAAQYAAILGGQLNTVRTQAAQSCIVAGESNLIKGSSLSSCVSGGKENVVDRSSFGGIVAGYNQTIILSDHSAIAGGQHNQVAGSPSSAIGGGDYNYVGGDAAMEVVVAGGRRNVATGAAVVISGGVYHVATGNRSTIGGGGFNSAIGTAAVVCGGENHRVSGDHGVIGGGEANTVTKDHAVVSGGANNRASGKGAVVSGGDRNVASAARSVVAGGDSNKALKRGASVVGGFYNTAAGEWSTALGGANNTIIGSFSLAAGRSAAVSHNNAVVLAFQDDGGIDGGSACPSKGDGTMHVCVNTGGFYVNDVLWNVTEIEIALDELQDDMSGITDGSGRISTLNSSLLASLAAISANFSTVDVSFTDLQATVEESIETLRENLNSTIIANSDAIDDVAGDLSSTQDDVSNVLPRIDDLESSIDVLGDNISTLGATIIFLHDDVSADVDTLQQRQQSINASVTTNIEALATYSSALWSNASAQQHEIDAIAATVGSVDRSLDGVIADVDMLQQRQEYINASVTTNSEALATYVGILSAVEDDVLNITQKLDVVETAVDRVTDNVSALSSDLIELHYDFASSTIATMASVNESAAMVLALGDNMSGLQDSFIALDADFAEYADAVQTNLSDLWTSVDSNSESIHKLVKGISTLNMSSTNAHIIIALSSNLSSVEDSVEELGDGILSLENDTIALWNNASAQRHEIDGILTAVDAVDLALNEVSAQLDNYTAGVDTLEAEVSEFAEVVQTNVSDLWTSVDSHSESIYKLLTATAAINMSSVDANVLAALSRNISAIGDSVEGLQDGVVAVEEDSSALWINASAQQHEIDAIAATVGSVDRSLDGVFEQLDNCTTTVEIQQTTITQLENTVGALQLEVMQLVANLSAVVETLGGLSQASTFVATSTDAATDTTGACGGAGPCPETTATPLPFQATTAELTTKLTTLPTTTQPTADAASTTQPPMHLQLETANMTLVNQSILMRNFAVHFATSLESTGRSDSNSEHANETVAYDVFLVQRNATPANAFLATSAMAWLRDDVELHFAVPVTRSYFVQVFATLSVTDAEGSVSELMTTCGLPSWQSPAVPSAASSTIDVSSVQCAELSASEPGSQIASVDDMLSEIAATGSSLGYLAGLDVVANAAADQNSTNGTDALAALLTSFVDSMESDGGSAEEDIAVLSAFVDAASGGSNDDALLDGIASVSENLDGTSGSTLDTFVQTVDDFASTSTSSSGVDFVSDLDNAIDAVCASDSSSSYSMSTFSVSCASVGSGDGDSDGVGAATVIETDSANVVISSSVDDGASVSVTSWAIEDVVDDSEDSDGVADTVYLADVTGVSVSGGSANSTDEADDTDEGFQVAITVASESGEALRKSMSCRYWDTDRGVWAERGVYLRGISFEPIEISKSSTEDVLSGQTYMTASAICVSSHLTLFTVTDSGDAVKLVETKIQTLSTRLEDLGSVDLLDGNTEVNYVVPLVFGAVTAIFVLTVVVAKSRGRSSAVSEARQLYVQEGRLRRENVLRNIEVEAFLRNWLPPRDVATLLALHFLTTNSFLALAFRWSHEHVVFTQADKAFMLYAAILSTFLVQAFLSDLAADSTGNAAEATATTVAVNDSVAGAETEEDFWSLLLNVLIGALFANVFLFPVKYLLPFMISNINSFTTATDVPRSLLERQMQKLRQRCGWYRSSASRKHRRIKRTTSAVQRENDAKERVAKLLGMWSSSSKTSSSSTSQVPENVARDAKESKEDLEAGGPAPYARAARIQRGLRFFSCNVPLPRVQAHRDEPDLTAEEQAAAAAPTAQIAGPTTKGPRRRLKRSVWAATKRHLDLLKLSKECAGDPRVVSVVSKFQARVRVHQKRRRLLRGIEFDSWRSECKSWRAQLSAITSIFLAALGVSRPSCVVCMCACIISLFQCSNICVVSLPKFSLFFVCRWLRHSRL